MPVRDATARVSPVLNQKAAMSRVPISVIVTTFNNARTLPALLESVRWADEVLIVNSFSTDATQLIAQKYGARFVQYKFRGYGPQKQLAMDLAAHDWVLLLDADERVTPELAQEIASLNTQGFSKSGYSIPRQEQIFWRMSSLKVRANGYLRLFDRRQTAMNEVPVHAAPMTTGAVGRTQHSFQHFGDTSIHAKVARVNSYSTGLVGFKARSNPLLMVFYFPVVILQDLCVEARVSQWLGRVHQRDGDGVLQLAQGGEKL